MTPKKIVTDSGPTTDYSAHRPFVVAPKELYRFQEDGVQYVYTACARTFIAEVYDRIFNPPKTPVLPKSYKGKTPAKPLELYKEDY